jgi:hypothetical protein
MEKSLRRIKITNGPQDHEGTFQTRTIACLPPCLESTNTKAWQYVMEMNDQSDGILPE